jgi:hypothetical protein
MTAYSRDFLSPMAGRIRGSIRAAKAGITDPTFVPLGEEVRAWKFVVDGRFEGVRGEIGEVVRDWFGTRADN